MKHGVKRHVGGFLLLTACLLISSANPVYAGDAVADIMNNDRFEGVITTISGLTGIIDHYFTVAITLVAFFIISAALLKNVCAGAYCANPKFWTKVAEAHETMEAKTLANVKDYFSGGGIMNTSAGGFGKAILAIIPNIKALTDFDDVEMEPKQYWMKAIPQMLVCVCIGVFIYNGYYRDTAAVVGDFGAEICQRVFTSVDPASFVDTITQTTRTPENIYASDKTLQGQFNHKYSMELYKVLLSESKEIKDFEQKTALMRDCENKAQYVSTTHMSEYWADSRVYDYEIGSLNMVPTKAQSGSAEWQASPKNKEDTSEYNVSGYLAVHDMSSCKDYINGNTHVYFTFVLHGTPVDESQAGVSDIIAQAGAWNGGTSVDYTCATPVSVPASKVGDSVTASSTYKFYPVETSQYTTGLVKAVDLINHVKTNNPDYANWTSVDSNDKASVRLGSHDGNGQLKIEAGTSLPATVSCPAVVTLQDPETGKTKEFTVKVTFNAQPTAGGGQ